MIIPNQSIKSNRLNLPKSICSILVDNCQWIWIILLPFAHFCTISALKITIIITIITMISQWFDIQIHWHYIMTHHSIFEHPIESKETQFLPLRLFFFYFPSTSPSFASFLSSPSSFSLLPLLYFHSPSSFSSSSSSPPSCFSNRVGSPMRIVKHQAQIFMADWLGYLWSDALPVTNLSQLPVTTSRGYAGPILPSKPQPSRKSLENGPK